MKLKITALKKMNFREIAPGIRLPLIVVGSAVVIAVLLILFKQEPEARVQRSLDPLVEVVRVRPRNYPLVIDATGTVQAKQEAKIAVQISGQVVWQSPNMVEGGFFTAGEPMFRIEADDYLNKLDVAKAEVAKAEEELEKIRARAHVASEEWELMKGLADTGSDSSKTSQVEKPSPLVLYNPQLKSAKAKLAAANANVKQAQLNVKRTTINAPFNSRVRTKSFDRGQYLRPGETVATIFGTDAFEVIVSVPGSELAWFSAMGPKGSAASPKGSAAKQPQEFAAEVFLDLGARQQSWKGKVSRFLGVVDPRGRMNRIVIEIANPLGDSRNFHNQTQTGPNGSAAKPKGSAANLAIGSFVRVKISAGELNNVFVIARRAVREASHVWVIDENNALKLKKVEISRLTKTEAVISNGLTAGDEVILSNIPGASSGMLLRRLKDSPRA